MRLRGRPSKYRKSLQDNPYWERVKSVIRARDGWRCQICGNIVDLEVHHITYYVNGQSIVGKELEHPEWLITLCHSCHAEVHKNVSHPLNPYNSGKKNTYVYKQDRMNNRDNDK